MSPFDVDAVLLTDPLLEFVELDGLLGCGEGVFGRKSSFRGGSIRAAGGSGKAGHWRSWGTAGMGCGLFELLAQAVSASASIGNASFISGVSLLVDGRLLGLDTGLVGGVFLAGLLGCLLVVDDRLPVG
jgi:hypothetical protein